jgi:hypothetical protein
MCGYLASVDVGTRWEAHMLLLLLLLPCLVPHGLAKVRLIVARTTIPKLWFSLFGSSRTAAHQQAQASGLLQANRQTA